MPEGVGYRTTSSGVRYRRTGGRRRRMGQMSGRVPHGFVVRAVARGNIAKAGGHGKLVRAVARKR